MHSFTKYEIDNIPSLVEPLLSGLLFGLYAALYIHVAVTYYKGGRSQRLQLALMFKISHCSD
jgi:hypothetical protein